MTDVSQGPGWWLASDGKWYPPHLHPGRHEKTTEPTWWRASDGNWYPPELHPAARNGGAARALAPASGATGAAPAPGSGPPVVSQPPNGAAATAHAPAGSHPNGMGPPAAAPANARFGPVGAEQVAPAPVPTPADLATPVTDQRLDQRARSPRDSWVFPASLKEAAGRGAGPLRLAFTVFAVLVVAYVVSVIARGGNADSTAIDGWGAAGLEVAGSILCLLRVAVRRPGRAVALTLGVAVLCWSAGDAIVTIYQSSVPPVTADVLYLAFYPLAYWAVVLLMRQEVAKIGTPTWLDGAVAGLGAAAVCAAFAFRGLEHSLGGHTLTTAMNLAYPIGDLLLLALVVGGTAMLANRKRATWILVALACGINAVGDTFNLLHNSVGMSAVGASFNATAWPVAILLFALAVWLQLDRPFQQQNKEVTPGFVLPALAAAAGLVILTVASVHPIERVAIGLAAASLVAAGIRMTMSVGTLRSMTIQRHRQSMTDELTGLGNRRYLLHVFDAYMGESVPIDQAMAVLFVDLDGFKEVNDSFGHAAGDHVLRQIGPRLAGSLRRTDVLVRLGGDEFAVLLPGADSSHAMVVAERLTSGLREPFTLDMLPINISASIGISVAPTDATDLAELLRCADAAMYRAKLSHAAFQIYDHAIDDDGDRLRLTEELRVAVSDGQLVLHFQPQLDLRNGSVTTVEALVRWAHPRLGMVSPLKFLPLAEEAGLMPALTARVLDDALAQCAAWRAQGLHITVSVNVSPTNLLAQGFAELVEGTLARHGLPGEALVLEITETCIVSDYDRSRRVIERLRHCGVVTSIDDFGAGFTSLAHLANLAVAELKLDQTFVADLATEERERDLELVRSTIGLGHALGLRVVAEGIETQETLSLLAALGCDLAQGFLISRPMPAGSLQFGVLHETWRDSAIASVASSVAGPAGAMRPAPASS
jgi:diguanylate cyclase (GGDEF)-like protein